MCKGCLSLKYVDVMMIELGFSEEEIKTFKHFFVNVVIKVLMAMAARNTRKPEENGRTVQKTKDCSSSSLTSRPTETETRPLRVQILFEKGYGEIEDQHRSVQLRQLELRREELLIRRDELLRERAELQRRLEELEVENQRLRRLQIQTTRELLRTFNLSRMQGTQLRSPFGKEFTMMVKAMEQGTLPDDYIALLEFLDASTDESSSDYEDDCDYDSGAESWDGDVEYN